MSKQPPGILIGQKGVQYGLQKVAAKKPGLAGAPAAQRKAAPTNVFGDDDSDDDNVERQIARQADKKRAAAKVQQMYEEALAEDPSVFDYDGVYDTIQEARVAPKQQDKVQRQSKYIASLLEQAQQRKREQDVLYERRMVKERQQEDHLYEDKERFVTGAYRRKLEEDKKWQEEERQKELDEQRNDVRKVGHLGNFYANLLTKNVAYGTAKQEDSKQPEATELPQGEVRSAAAGEEGARGPAPSSRAGSASREGSPAAASEPSGAPGGALGPSAKVLAQLDRYDKLRLEAERALQRKNRQQQPEQGPGQEGPSQEGLGAESKREEVQAPEAMAARAQASGAAASPAAEARRTANEHGAAREAGGNASGAGGNEAGGPAPAPGAAGVGKRRNDDSAVQSARERYLARKQQKTG